MTKNMAASVRQRILNLAKAHNKPFNELLQHYALERWLYRLSLSPYARHLILKGALMLTAWQVPMTRPTRDIDLLAYASNDLDAVKQMIAEIGSIPVDDDGLIFDARSVMTERITEDAKYEGVRATFQCNHGNGKIPMQIDISFSDVITPGPVQIDYPTVLDMPAPRLRSYNRETAIAEKFEAMVKLGELNSRMKDFFDLWTLAAGQSFNGALLAEAVQKTFEQRGTSLTPEAVCFQSAFGKSKTKQVQWKAFIKRSGLPQAPAEFEVAWSLVMHFMKPIAEGGAATKPFSRTWSPSGPWA